MVLLAAMTEQNTPDPSVIQTALSVTSVQAQRIVLNEFVCLATIGATEQERASPQRITIDLVLEVDASPPKSDSVSEVLSYGLVVRELRRLCQDSCYALLETLADSLAAGFFAFSQVRATQIRVQKLDRYAEIKAIGIEICRRRAAP